MISIRKRPKIYDNWSYWNYYTKTYMIYLFLYQVMDRCSRYISPAFEGGYIQAVTGESNPSVHLLKASFNPMALMRTAAIYLSGFFWWYSFLSAYMHVYTCNHLLVLLQEHKSMHTNQILCDRCKNSHEYDHTYVLNTQHLRLSGAGKNRGHIASTALELFFLSLGCNVSPC